MYDVNLKVEDLVVVNGDKLGRVFGDAQNDRLRTLVDADLRAGVARNVHTTVTFGGK